MNGVDFEKNIELKVSQYEMLSKTLDDMVKRDRDTDAVDDVIRSMRDTIEEISEMRKCLKENEAKRCIPVRKRNKCNSSPKEDYKYVDSSKFEVEASYFGITNIVVDKVFEHEYKCNGNESNKKFSMDIKDVCVDYGGGYAPLCHLLEESMKIGIEEGAKGDVTLTVFDSDGEVLYTKTFVGCMVDSLYIDGSLNRSYDCGSCRYIRVTFSYDAEKYTYGKQEQDA